MNLHRLLPKPHRLENQLCSHTHSRTHALSPVPTGLFHIFTQNWLFLSSAALNTVSHSESSERLITFYSEKAAAINSHQSPGVCFTTKTPAITIKQRRMMCFKFRHFIAFKLPTASSQRNPIWWRWRKCSEPVGNSSSTSRQRYSLLNVLFLLKS